MPEMQPGYGLVAEAFLMARAKSWLIPQGEPNTKRPRGLPCDYRRAAAGQSPNNDGWAEFNGLIRSTLRARIRVLDDASSPSHT